MIALSCSRADIMAAIAVTSDGGIIDVPAGMATWTAAITVGSKSLTIRGAGIGQTVILLTGSSGRDGWVLGTTESDVSGFDLILSTSVTDCGFYSRGQDARIHHCRVENATGVASKLGVFADGTTSGGIPHPTVLVDNCEFLNTRILIHGNADLFASVDWNANTKIGNVDQSGVMYVEDCTFERVAGIYTTSQDVMDANYGGRFVFRYNTVTNGRVECHSVQGKARAGKSWEVYENTFNATASIFAAIWMRAGTGVIYNNTVTGLYDHAIVFDNVRSFTSYAYPPGDGDGTSDWDGNTAGQAGWPLRDQIGRGKDASVYAGTGTGPLPAQASEPAYVWNNTKSGVATTPFIHNTGSAIKPGGSSADIVASRDFFLIARPASSAYTYPHPLTGTVPGPTGGVAVGLSIIGLPGTCVEGVPVSVTVQAIDNVGDPATSYRGTVTFTSTDGAATLPSNYTFTALDNGTKAFILGVTLATPGSRSITVTDVDDALLTETAITTVAAAPVSTEELEISSADADWTRNTSYSLTVDAFNGSHVPWTAYTGTVAFSSSDPLAVLPVGYTFASASHTFTGVKLLTVGVQSITVTDATNGLSATLLVTVLPAVVVGSGTGLTLKHHIDFLNDGYVPGDQTLGGGSDKQAYKGLLYWNPSLVDGDPQYEIELCITNPNAGAGRCSFGRESTYGTLVEMTGFSIALPAGVTKKTFRGSFEFPIDGFESSWNAYVLIVDNVGAKTGNGISVFSARMKVAQTGATKGIFWRPLSNGAEGDASSFWTGYSLLDGALNVPEAPLNAGLWERIASDYIATSTTYKIYSILAGTHSAAIFGQHVSSGLYDVTASVRVQTQVANNPGPNFFVTPQFSFNAADVVDALTDRNKFQWQWEVTQVGDQHKLFGAQMLVVLSGISRLTTWARVSKQTGTSTNGFAAVVPTSRVLADDFSRAIELFTEVSGFNESGVSGHYQLQTAGASDTALTGTDIAGTEVSVTGTVRDVFRSAPYSAATLPTGERIICRAALASGSGADTQADWVLIGARYEAPVVPPLPCPPKVTIIPVCKMATITPVCKRATIACC